MYIDAASGWLAGDYRLQQICSTMARVFFLHKAKTKEREKAIRRVAKAQRIYVKKTEPNQTTKA